MFASLESRQHSLNVAVTSEDRCLVFVETEIVIMFSPLQ